jgi:hypothetical protein
MARRVCGFMKRDEKDYTVSHFTHRNLSLLSKMSKERSICRQKIKVMVIVPVPKLHAINLYERRRKGAPCLMLSA